MNALACLSLWKWRSFIQASPDLNLDCTWIYILCASPHVTPTWISHQARRGFLHGKSSFFSFCTGCDNTHASCISIYHTQSFLTKLALWLGHQIFTLLTVHMSPNVPYGLLALSDTVACVSTTSLAWEMLLSCNIMQHHATFLFGILCWCTCHVSIILIKLGSISSRYV